MMLRRGSDFKRRRSRQTAGTRRIARRSGTRGEIEPIVDHLSHPHGDPALLREARTALPAGTREQRASPSRPADQLFVATERAGIADWAKQLRVHQWAKNGLIFLPLFLAHKFTEPHAILSAVMGFVVFGCTTSANYIINDLVDLKADRLHPTKRRRPLAAGRISIAEGIVVAVFLMVGGLVGGVLLSPAFAAAMVAYLGLAIAYSFRLKRLALADVFTITTLFTLRIASGTAVIDAKWSPWLLSFSMFFFFSMALAKRNVELVRVAGSGQRTVSGRGYEIDEAPLTTAFGTAAAVGAMIIMLLYITNEAAVSGNYRTPGWLFPIPAMMFLWTLRIWLLSYRGLLNDDPVIFALRDRVSWMLGVVAALGLALAF